MSRAPRCASRWEAADSWADVDPGLLHASEIPPGTVNIQPSPILMASMPAASAMQISVKDQQTCYADNGYPTQNTTNCCNAGFNKFKFYPNQSCHGAPRSASVQLAGESTAHSEPITIQTMSYVVNGAPASAFVYKLTNLQLQPATANNAIICLTIGNPCPTMEVGHALTNGSPTGSLPFRGPFPYSVIPPVLPQSFSNDGQVLEYNLYSHKGDNGTNANGGYECCPAGIADNAVYPFDSGSSNPTSVPSPVPLPSPVPVPSPKKSPPPIVKVTTPPPPPPPPLDSPPPPKSSPPPKKAPPPIVKRSPPPPPPDAPPDAPPPDTPPPPKWDKTMKPPPKKFPPPLKKSPPPKKYSPAPMTAGRKA